MPKDQLQAHLEKVEAVDDRVVCNSLHIDELRGLVGQTDELRKKLVVALLHGISPADITVASAKDVPETGRDARVSASTEMTITVERWTRLGEKVVRVFQAATLVPIGDEKQLLAKWQEQNPKPGEATKWQHRHAQKLALLAVNADDWMIQELDLGAETDSDGSAEGGIYAIPNSLADFPLGATGRGLVLSRDSAVIVAVPSEPAPREYRYVGRQPDENTTPESSPADSSQRIKLEDEPLHAVDLWDVTQNAANGVIMSQGYVGKDADKSRLRNVIRQGYVHQRLGDMMEITDIMRSAKDALLYGDRLEASYAPAA